MAVNKEVVDDGDLVVDTNARIEIQANVDGECNGFSGAC